MNTNTALTTKRFRRVRKYLKRAIDCPQAITVMDEDPEDQYEELEEVTNDLIDDDSDREASDDDDEVAIAVSEVVDLRTQPEITVTEVLITDPTRWTTIPHLTENEFVDIIAKRTTMLQTSNDACIDDIEEKTPEEIALEEIRLRRCPFAVKRRATEKPVTYDFIPVNYLLMSPDSWNGGLPPP